MRQIIAHRRLESALTACQASRSLYMLDSAEARPRPLRRGPLRGLDDPPRGRASEMQPAHPADSSLGAGRRRPRHARLRGPRQRRRPLDPSAWPAPTCSSSRTPPTPSGRRPPASARRTLRADGDRRDRAPSSHGGGGLVVLGETEHDKYGNNLNELLARFGIEVENTTVQDYEHHREAPVLGPRRPRRQRLAQLGRRPARPRRGGLLLPRRHARARATAPRRSPARHGSAEPSRARRSRRHRARRGPRRRARRLRPLRRRLHRRARPRATSGSTSSTGPPSPSSRSAAAAADSAAAADPAWTRAQRRRRGAAPAQEPDGSVDPDEHDAAASREFVETIATAAEALAQHFPHQADYIDALGADLRAWADPGFGKPDFTALDRGLPSRAAPRGRDRAPRRLPDVQAERLPRHLLRGADRPRPLARVARRARGDRATTTPSSSRSTLVDYTAGYDSECAVLFPETFSRRRSARQPTSARSSATARPSACAASRAAPPRCSSSTCRPTPPRCSPRRELSAERLHPLGPPPRPHAHARRPPVRPVHDPPAQPLLDVRAGGASLRPDGVRRGRSSSRREGFAFARYVQYAILFDRLFRFPITGTAGPQLRRARRPAPVRLPPQGGLPALDRQPADDRLGPTRRRSRARCATRVQELYHSGIDRSKPAPVDRRARPRRRVRHRRRRTPSGRRQARPARGRGAEAARRPGPRRRVPAEPLLRAAAAEDAGCARSPVRRRRPGSLGRAHRGLRLRP